MRGGKRDRAPRQLVRPAVERALQVLADRRREGPMSDKEREMMFGAAEYQRR